MPKLIEFPKTIAGVIVAAGVVIMLGTIDYWLWSNCCNQPGPQGEQGIQGPRGVQGVQGVPGEQGAAAPSALCTWENTTYSTGAECNYTNYCSESISSGKDNIFSVCQADGTWRPRNDGRLGPCPSGCGQ